MNDYLELKLSLELNIDSLFECAISKKCWSITSCETGEPGILCPIMFTNFMDLIGSLFSTFNYFRNAPLFRSQIYRLDNRSTYIYKAVLTCRGEYLGVQAVNSTDLVKVHIFQV